ncbi:MAG: radical SAM protein [Chloroflexi bacterium]|nr:radical SAM protein [Chloroflexota bacterium]
MRVLFVVKQIDYEPMGIMHLSSVLKAAGHEVDLCIVAQQDPVERASEWQPGVLAYSLSTGSQDYYTALNQRIRQALPDAFSVFGGAHGTFFPEMIEADKVDGVCMGEGEYALLELVDRLDAGQDPYDTENWWFKRSDGSLIKNTLRSLIQSLDELPLPDRDIVYKHHRPTAMSKVKHFITGRGCPYDCSYCFNHAYWDIYKDTRSRRVRQRSVDRTLEEVCYVRGHYPLEFVVFLDDTFNINKRWIAEFTEKYPKVVGLPFFCNVRANLVTPGMVAQLKRAGCVSVGMGIEAGNDDMRNFVLKRNMPKEMIIEACRTIRDAGLHLISTNMIGLPGGNLEQDIETLDLNIACNPSYANTFLFQPYPKTALGEYAQENGYMEGAYEDIFTSAWETSVLKFPEGEKRQIENLQKWFALVVEFPWLRSLMRPMLKLPRNKGYWLMYKLWKGYAVKQRIHPHSLSTREYLEMVSLYMKLD